MAYYHVCPNCGSNLDPGETCDCERESKVKEETEGKDGKIYGGHIKATSRTLPLYEGRDVTAGQLLFKVYV